MDFDDISSLLEVQVQEVDEEKRNEVSNVARSFPSQNFSEEENKYYEEAYKNDVASVRFLKLHCTMCDDHIGSAPAESHNMHEHPHLRTLLCSKCREFYGEGTFEKGEDDTDMFCRWCANGGNLFCCSFCSNTFCSKCIKRNFNVQKIKEIEDEDNWKCFVCDPKDLYSLRSMCKALLTHVSTVKRILTKEKEMGSKEIQEKLHLDETKCCARKRKRRRITKSMSEDENDSDDALYVPTSDRVSSAKKRKFPIRQANGFADEEVQSMTNLPEHDFSDLLIPCEQTMIEGDAEILNPHNFGKDGSDDEVSSNIGHALMESGEVSLMRRITVPPQSTTPKPSFIRALPKTKLLNPVPLRNLLKLKVANPANAGQPRLYAVPMSSVPKGINRKNLTILQPPKHFLLSGNSTKIADNIKTIPRIVSGARIQTVRTVQPKQLLSAQVPKVIDLEDDDDLQVIETEERNKDFNKENTEDIGEDEPVVVHSNQQPRAKTKLQSLGTILNNATMEPAKKEMTIMHRDQRFKRMLQLQSQEIDSTLTELRTKILKLVQISSFKTNESDLLSSAGLCTKRFHRALRKTLVDLSHINDRVVRDFVHWKKSVNKDTLSDLQKKEKSDLESTNQVEGIVENTQESSSTEEDSTKEKETGKVNNSVQDKNQDSANQTMSQTKQTISDKRKYRHNTSDIPLEMTCTRDSETDSSDGEDIDDMLEKTLEPTTLPPEFAALLDHLSIFKRKPTGVKAVGNSCVDTEDKACQAYDILWRDYEKCIGYSLVNKDDGYNGGQEEIQDPVQPDENFGEKYQEQFLFYLQHIEDFGIESDEYKGVYDSNIVPVATSVTDDSPAFIPDSRELLTPVTNGCPSSSEYLNLNDCCELSPQVTHRKTPTPTDKSDEQLPDEEISEINDENDANVCGTVNNIFNSKGESTNASDSVSDYDYISNTTNNVMDVDNMDDKDITAVDSVADMNDMSNTEDSIMNTDENDLNATETTESNAPTRCKAVEELVKIVTKLSEDLQAEKNSIDEYSNELNNESRNNDEILELYAAATNIDHDCSIIE